MRLGQSLTRQAQEREVEGNKAAHEEDLNGVFDVYHAQREEESLVQDETTKAARTISQNATVNMEMVLRED